MSDEEESFQTTPRSSHGSLTTDFSENIALSSADELTETSVSTPLSSIRASDTLSTVTLSEGEILSSLNDNELNDVDDDDSEKPIINPPVSKRVSTPVPISDIPKSVEQPEEFPLLPQDYLRICGGKEPCNIPPNKHDPEEIADEYICKDRNICDPFKNETQIRRYGDLTKVKKSNKNIEEEINKKQEEKYFNDHDNSLYEPPHSLIGDNYSETSSAELDLQLAEMCKLTEKVIKNDNEIEMSIPIIPLTSEQPRFHEQPTKLLLSPNEEFLEASETPTETTEPTLLEPNHPMMERFQKALRAHLLRQLQMIENETKEMEGLKDSRKNECQLINEQYSLSLIEKDKQHQTLESYRNTLGELNQLRQKLNEEMIKIRKRLEILTTQWKTDEHEVNELRTQQCKSHHLINNMRKWLEDMESQVKISKRVSSKTKTERARLAEEKRKQDLLLLRLEAERGRLEQESSQLDCHFRTKMHEREIAANTLAEAEADLQVLRSEQRRLESAWRSVAVSMSHRDKTYANVQSDLYETRERFKLIQIEEANKKKELINIQNEHEDLDEMQARLSYDTDTQKFKLNDLKKKIDLIIPKRNLLTQIIEQNETNLNLLEQEYQILMNQENTIRREMEAGANYKIELEKKIMISLYARTTHDNVVKAQEKALNNLKQKTKDQEFVLILKENELAKSLLTFEQTRNILERSKQNLKESNKKLILKQEETNQKKKEFTNAQHGYGGKQLNLERLNKKLADLMLASGNNQGLSLSEIKIADLKGSLEEATLSLEQQTKEWTRHQMYMVSLAEKRREQVEFLDTTEKQVTLLEQKTHRYEVMISDYKTKEAHLARNIIKKQQMLLMANSKLVEKRDTKENLDRQNSLIESEYTIVLKEAALESSKLEQEIEHLNKQIVYRREDLDIMQRASLAWDNKVKQAKEAKEAAKADRKGIGELASMRAEIHRMKCRLGQLHRVQEKLASDMEKSVTRRDSIYDRAKAKEMRGTGNFSRVKFLRKMQQIENKVKNLHKEIKEIDLRIRTLRKNKKETEDMIINKQIEIGEIDAKTNLLQNKIQYAQLQKLLNLDQLVRRQRKNRRLMDAKRGCRPLRWRTVQQIEKQKEIALNKISNLLSIIELLFDDFPKGSEPRPYLDRVNNLLRLPAS